MKKRISLLLILIMTLVYNMTVSASTPKLVAPKLPTIPTIKVENPDGMKEATKRAVSEAVKNIDWSKFDFSFSLKKIE